MDIIKRDGKTVPFITEKIRNAIAKANQAAEEDLRMEDYEIDYASKSVERACRNLGETPTVEKVQDLVETELARMGHMEIARRYMEYRALHSVRRGLMNSTDEAVLTLLDGSNEQLKYENSNKNTSNLPTQKNYIKDVVSEDLMRRIFLPDEILKAHNEGIIHFHDMGDAALKQHNCCLVNLRDMFENGTVISGTRIDTPKSFSTACTVATQIIAQVSSSQYGGVTISIAHLAPYVDTTRRKLMNRYMWLINDVNREEYTKLVEQDVREDIKRGVQTIQYQVLTLLTCNGQTPFITINLDINEAPEGREREDLALVIEEVLNQRILGVKNKAGAYITPAFPKLIYVLDENNIYPDSPYWSLTQLAAKCTAKRMVPDYVSAKKMREFKDGCVYPPMGCRSFLTSEPTVLNEDGSRKFYGRFNQGVVTINLADAALSSGKDMEKFWSILEDRLELCHRALRFRHDWLCGTKSDVAPILWQDGALARLKPGETIDKLLYGGYSTISLGYCALYECTHYMTGRSHTDPEATPFALAVMQKLNDKCAQWRSEENIAYSVYGTPLESTTWKFAKCLKDRFGEIPEITDHDYVTNSFHVNVREHIDAFSKLGLEAQFQKLSPGGTISYVECPNMTANLDAVLDVIQYIYNNTMYAELNIKSDYCQNCGFDGEIRIIETEDGKLDWECPNCGCRDHNKLNVARRTCGYIGSQFWNFGRTAEIRDRVLHIGDDQNVDISSAACSACK